MAKAKKQEIHFALDEVMCLQGKYTNLEPYGNEQAARWRVLFSNIMLSHQQYNDLMADPHADRAIFNQVKDVWEPMPWLKNVELKFLETFEDAVCTILYSKNEKEKSKCEVEFSKCEVKIVSLEALTTRVVAMSIAVTLSPKRRDLVLIHEHQHTQVKLSVSDAKVAAKKKSGQEEMFDNQGASKDAEETEESEDKAAASPFTGAHLGKQASTSSDSPETSTPSSEANPDDSKEFEAAAAKHVQAFKNAGGKTAIDGRSERVKHRDRTKGAH